MEKDADKLFALYEQGYATAALSWDALVRYLRGLGAARTCVSVTAVPEALTMSMLPWPSTS